MLVLFIIFSYNPQFISLLPIKIMLLKKLSFVGLLVLPLLLPYQASAISLDTTRYTITRGPSLEIDLSLTDTSNQSIAFSDDGLKIFILGNTDDEVNQLTLGTAFDVSTISSTPTATFPLSPFGTAKNMVFNPAGTKMFVLEDRAGSDPSKVHQYTLAAPFDLSSSSTGSSSYTFSEEGAPLGLAFNTAGTKMFITGLNAEQILEYTISIPFDITSTVTRTSSRFPTPTLDTQIGDIKFNIDGTKMFLLGNLNKKVYEFTLGTAFDVSTRLTAVDEPSFTFLFGGVESYRTLAFNPARTKMFLLNRDSNNVHRIISYDFVDLFPPPPPPPPPPPTTFTASTPSFVISISGNNDFYNDIAFSPDGLKIFITQLDGATVNQYTLGTAFDVSTISRTDVETFSVSGSSPRGIAFNTAGTKMFVVGVNSGTGSDHVREYRLTTGFDLATASAADGFTFSVHSTDTDPSGIAFNTDGTKMFITGDEHNNVYEYMLSTGFDLSTAGTDSFTFPVGGTDTRPDDIEFNTDGTKMIILGDQNNKVYEFVLRIGFDLSTASAAPILEFSLVGDQHRGLAFNPDRTQMFVISFEGSSSVSRIRSYDVTGFNITSITADADADADALNAVILPRLVQAMLASTVVAIDSRIDASFSGAGQLQVAQVASYQLDGQTVRLDDQTRLSTNLQDTLIAKLPTYAKLLKDDKMDWKQMLGNSSFVLPLDVGGGDGNSTNRNGATLWGRGDYTNLSGKNWKGNVVSAQLGADTRVRDDLLVGGLLSSSKGDVDYTASGSGDTEYKHSITSIHPYIAWSVNDINLWGSAGYGQGKLEIEDTADKNNTNTKLFSLSGGAKGQVAEGVNLKSDLNLMQLRIDESKNKNIAKNIAAQKISSQRLRLLLEIERERQLETGVLKPTLEIGARYDGGDGNTGTGAVLNGSLDYTNAITGWTVGGKIHTLIGRKDYKEWGISGVVSKHVAVNGKGVSFNLTPSYGQNQDNGGGSAEQAWQQPAEVRNSGNDHDYNMRINTRLGYGFAPSGNGLLTPYSEATFGESNRYLFGINWQRHSRFGMTVSSEHDAGNTKNHVLGVNWTRPRYTTTLSAGRNEANNGTAKHNVLLESRIGF